MKRSNINWLATIIELFVVFLGVTAGFVLQNYNQGKSEKELEAKYLQGFRDDVTENIASLESQYDSDSVWLFTHHYAILQIVKDSLRSDSAALILESMAMFSKFTAQNVTYLNVTNSGNLGLIRDYDLRQHLVKYHMELDEFNLLEEYYHDYHKKDLIPYLIRNFDIFKKVFALSSGHQQLEFQNLFASTFSFKQQRIEGYHDLIESSNTLLAELDKAIK